MKRILIKFTHGLGDAVQLTVALQHLRKYRPDWELYLHAKRGKHSVGYGYCTQVWHDQEPGPDEKQFHHIFDLGWYENYAIDSGFRGGREEFIADTVDWWQDLTGHRIVYWAANVHTTQPVRPCSALPRATSVIGSWCGTPSKS